MGLPGIGSSCSAGHHTDIHGSADYCSDRQPEGAQAEGSFYSPPLPIHVRHRSLSHYFSPPLGVAAGIIKTTADSTLFC